ncbi:hypothetical protein [Amycolatopsis magusensis]|uniref:hypothetical protein n=1 Tax=Amycolatopsis magusensis TaxID=882444 RepID=UPI0037A2108B
MHPDSFDPREWTFLTPLVDPTFVAGTPTPKDLRYLRKDDPGWFPLFSAYVQHHHGDLVHHLGEVDQFERRHKEKYFDDVEGFGMLGRVAKTFSAQNLNDSLNPYAEAKKKFEEESARYEASVTALGVIFPAFVTKVDRLRELMAQRGGAFNVMTGAGNSAELIGRYWEVYGILGRVKPQLEPLRAGFRLLHGLTGIERTSVASQFKDFRAKFDAAEQTVAGVDVLAPRLWQAIDRLSKEVTGGGFPAEATTAEVGEAVRAQQRLLAEIGNAYRLAAEACATWAVANAEDLAAKKIQLDNPVLGSVYRVVNGLLKVGVGVSRIIDLDTQVLSTPLSVLQVAIETAPNFANQVKTWNRPDVALDRLGDAAAFGLAGNAGEVVEGVIKYPRLGETVAGAGMDAASDVLAAAATAAEYAPVVGGAFTVARGVQDLMSIDLREVKTIEEQEQLEYARELVTTCLGSWHHLGILDFDEGVLYRGITDFGVWITVTDRQGRKLDGRIDSAGQFFADAGHDLTVDLARQAASHDTDRGNRHQAVDAKPRWANLSFTEHVQEGSLNVYKFTGPIEFEDRGEHNGDGVVRVYYSPAEFRYLYWEADDLPTQALWTELAQYQDRGLVEEQGGRFAIRLDSPEYRQLSEQDGDGALRLGDRVATWNTWHDQGLIVLAGPYAHHL